MEDCNKIILRSKLPHFHTLDKMFKGNSTVAKGSISPVYTLQVVLLDLLLLSTKILTFHFWWLKIISFPRSLMWFNYG